MSFVHKNSGVCGVSELDLHAVSLTQRSVLKSAFTGIETKYSLGDCSNITFTIGKSQEYTDLSENYVHLELEAVKADGATLRILSSKTFKSPWVVSKSLITQRRMVSEPTSKLYRTTTVT